jgi:hypothetical protein
LAMSAADAMRGADEMAAILSIVLIPIECVCYTLLRPPLHNH